MWIKNWVKSLPVERLLDPDSGDIYKCKMWVKDDVLTARGYIGISLFGRSQEWWRVK